MQRTTHAPVHGYVRLTIRINDQDYLIIPQAIGEHGDAPSYRLRKLSSGDEYVVRNSNIGISCTCPDFCTRRRVDGACKHIKAMQVFWMLR